jgi:hypothetical protein
MYKKNRRQSFLYHLLHTQNNILINNIFFCRMSYRHSSSIVLPQGPVVTKAFKVASTAV